MEIRERIKAQRKSRGLTQANLAELVGVSLMTVKRWEWGQRSPRAEELKNLAKVLNTSVPYLMGETDTPERFTPKVNSTEGSAPAQPEIESNAHSVEMVAVPIVRNIQACCGDGNAYFDEVEWEDEGEYLVPYADLSGYLWQVGKQGIRCIVVEGDSMEPQLHDGDMVVIARVEPLNGDIAIVKYRGRILARVFSEDRDGTIRLHPFNESFKDIVIPFEAREDEREFGIVGKVFLLLPRPRRIGGAWL